MTEFWTGLGDFLQFTFQIFPTLGNSANLAFVLIMSAAFIYWMGQLFKYKRAGQE
ncbi:hypothetical protein HZ996_02085 [Cryomorphaceae bacterium]|nr:hypothetical protein HZ996_02085 [Cryomorphaceae bacterium]